MNYDAILAIYNCFKDKINYEKPIENIKKEMPDEVKQWYLKNKDDINSKNVKLEINKGNNGELCTYYQTKRENEGRVVTDSLGKNKKIEEELEVVRYEMTNKSIYNYLNEILNNIDIPPFKAKKLADSSVYECKALSNNSEQIKIDYDENKFTTAIEITDGKKFLNVTFLPKLIATNYSGVIALPKTEKKINRFFKLFRKKSKFELINQDKVARESITKEEIVSIVWASGTIYSEEGIYIFNVEDGIFRIDYFDQETIERIISTNFNKKNELVELKELLIEQKELGAIDFKAQLENVGLLPNATYNIPCLVKEQLMLVNKAYINPKELIKDLYKTN